MANAKMMQTIREGAVAWIDEHEITDKQAEQLFRYIEAALDCAEQDTIRTVQKSAWDEGHNHCFHVEDPGNRDRNPYT